MPETTNKRVGINLSETAKGLADAIDAAREVIKEKGLQEVHA